MEGILMGEGVKDQKEKDIGRGHTRIFPKGNRRGHFRGVFRNLSRGGLVFFFPEGA